jgi:cysteine synthase A
MANIKKSITELIGHTPLLELTNIEKSRQLKGNLIVKLEFFNVNQSTKDRIAVQIIENAEREGKLKPGDTIVETSSGNTGIAVAGIAAAKGYKFRAYLQDQVSQERYQVVQALGGETVKFSSVPVAKKVLDEQDGDFVLAMKALKEYLREDKEVFFSDQCFNQANVEAHYKTTGPEIWEDTDGKVDIVVISTGTGGTVSGVGKYLKEKNPNVKIVAVEPGPNSVPTKENPNPEEITGIHAFKDQPIERKPDTLDLSVIDEVVPVETPQAYEAAREVAKKEGILVGTSAGAAVYVAAELAAKEENAGKNIIAIVADTGLRYLSTNLFQGK